MLNLLVLVPSMRPAPHAQLPSPRVLLSLPATACTSASSSCLLFLCVPLPGSGERRDLETGASLHRSTVSKHFSRIVTRDWSRLKPRARNSIRVSHVGAEAQAPGPSSAAFSGPLAGSWTGDRAAGLDAGAPSGGLSHNATTLSPRQGSCTPSSKQIFDELGILGISVHKQRCRQAHPWSTGPYQGESPAGGKP